MEFKMQPLAIVLNCNGVKPVCREHATDWLATKAAFDSWEVEYSIQSKGYFVRKGDDVVNCMAIPDTINNLWRFIEI